MTLQSPIIAWMTPTDDSGAVFRALADDGRRALLDALREGDGQPLTELCTVLPAMTRFGVMKHLAVLEAAGLIVTERLGRQKLHYLNPVPLQQMHDRWLSKYAQPFTRAMSGLQRSLGQREHARNQPEQEHAG